MPRATMGGPSPPGNRGQHGAAASFMLDDRGARMIDNSNNDIRSATDIFVKGMGRVTAVLWCASTTEAASASLWTTETPWSTGSPAFGRSA